MTRIALALLLVAAAAWPTEPVPELDTVLVVGEQSGPGLWMVSKGDHVLWILGTHGPLPRDMKWRSKDVEAVIAQSQQVIFPGRAETGPAINAFWGVTLLPAAYRAARNPDGAKLQQLLPPDTFAKWQQLKQQYIGRDDGLETWRPALAGARLRRAAIEKSGLRNRGDIQSVVRNAATRHRVPVRTLPAVSMKTRVENARGILNNARKLQLPDTECFARSLDRLEPDIEALKQRANAWAIGDIAVLRRLSGISVQSDDCVELLTQAILGGELTDLAGAEQVLTQMRRQAQLAAEILQMNWLDAARLALEKNRSTFAVLPIARLLESGGYLASLRAMGYNVVEPRP